MKIEESRVRQALQAVSYPGFSRDIVSFGVVGAVRVLGSTVALELRLDDVAPAVVTEIEQRVRAALTALDPGIELRLERKAGAGAAALKMVQPAAAARPSAARSGSLGSELLPQVRHTIAVASGKGGVGKSTVAVNLAVALGRCGARVGLLDADIYGPSIPIMMGTREVKPEFDAESQKLIPIEKHGVRFMSLGFLVEPDSAVIWRGPMVMKAIEQLLRDVLWGALDVLVVDMPPGTGDAQLTLSQRIRLAGAVVVTTPQDVALADAIKGVAMFRKVEVPVLGIVENMSYFVCAHCSERSEIFGHGGGKAQAERLGVPFLGEIPLDPAIRVSGDAGQPLAAASGAAAEAFSTIARGLLMTLTPEPAGSEGIFERFKKVWGKPTPP